jgi:Zn-dependent peptidase ImmA (M78 family)
VQDVADPLATVLRATTAELGRRCAASARIARLIAGLTDLEEADRIERRIAWLAGLGSSIDEMLDRWQSVAKRLAASGVALTEALADGLFVRGTPKASLMFGAVAPNITERDVDALTAFLLSLYTSDSVAARADSDEWGEMTQSIDERSAPWRQGYELAQSFLERIDADQRAPTDIDDLLDVLGVAVSEVALEDSEVRGLAAAGAHHRPFIGLNPNYPFHDRVEVQRFTKGHELCHVLFDRTAAKELAVASGPWAPVEIEQRANAFAAMILMPEPLVRAKLGELTTPVTDLDQLTDLAARLGVSIRALAWHATNLGLVSRVVTQLLSVPRSDSENTTDI